MARQGITRHRDHMQESNAALAERPVILERYLNAPRRILLVDDDPLVCQLGAEVLMQQGYEVKVAGDGEAGWEALHAGGYDLLITDNNMPRLSGVELLKKIRAARMALPVIIATGSLTPSEFEMNPWLQPAVLLSKPYSIGQLLGAVKEILHPAMAPRRPFVAGADWQAQPSAEGSL